MATSSDRCLRSRACASSSSASGSRDLDTYQKRRKIAGMSTTDRNDDDDGAGRREMGKGGKEDDTSRKTRTNGSTFVRWSLIKSIKNHAYGMSSQIQLVLLSFSVSVLRMIQHPSLPACCALKVAGRPSTTTGVSQHHELIPLNGHFRCTNPRERRSVIAVERYVDW